VTDSGAGGLLYYEVIEVENFRPVLACPVTKSCLSSSSESSIRGTSSLT